MNAACPPSWEKAITEVRDGAAAHKFRFVLLELIQKLFLLGMLHQLHATALETKRSELAIGNFKEYVNDRIAEAAELKFFHSYRYLQERWNHTA
jgi:hypothetical protein